MVEVEPPTQRFIEASAGEGQWRLPEADGTPSTQTLGKPLTHPRRHLPPLPGIHLRVLSLVERWVGENKQINQKGGGTVL